MHQMSHNKKIETIKKMKRLLHSFEKKEQWNLLWDMLNSHTFCDPQGIEWLREKCRFYLYTKIIDPNETKQAKA
jgi:hypothetical protein